MSTSPPQSATAPSSKRPLEEPSSPSGPGDQPDAKRPALDKVLKEEPTTSDAPSETTEAPAAAKQETEVKSEQNGNGTADHDTVVPDAPTGVPTGSEVLQNGQNLQNQSQGRQDETNWLHVRAIISSAEAATVIGKGGENVSQIRKLSAARCTVSDYARGAVERILTVSGQVDAVAKVCHSLTKECELTNSNPSGIRPHHSHTEPRASRSTIHATIEDLPSTTPHPTHPHRLNHRQGWCPHSRDSRGIGCTPQCI